MKVFYLLTFCLFILASCLGKKDSLNTNDISKRLRIVSEGFTKSEVNDDLKTFVSYYDRNVICMPEYQSTLEGKDKVEVYFKEIFSRQKIKSFQRNAEEIIDLDSTVIELGSFKKEYSEQNNDSTIILNGKYWNTWTVDVDGNFKLKGECFGYFHPVQNPGAFVVPIPDDVKKSVPQEMPFELLAYNALMEKGVRDRDGELRSRFFTEDGMFMPFQEPNVKGIEKIKPYLVAYSNRGQVKIDSIEVYPYHFQYFEDYVLEYPKFYVKFSSGNYRGKTEGKGIRIWKRQPDKSLRLYREIGTHNHLE